MYRRPLRSDEIYHSWLSKGAQKKNHKYIARINLGDKFRYFYDSAALKAFREGVNDVKDAVQNKIDYHVTGEGYKRDARNARRKSSKLYSDAYVNEISKRTEYESLPYTSKYRNASNFGKTKMEFDAVDKMSSGPHSSNMRRNAESYANDAKASDQKYYTHSLKGISESLTKKASNFLSKFFDNNKSTSWNDPRPKKFTEDIITEDIITETKIPEKRITETRIPEKRITETKIPEKRVTETRIPETKVEEEFGNYKPISGASLYNDVDWSKDEAKVEERRTTKDDEFAEPPITGSSLYNEIDWDAEEDRVNEILSRQDNNFVSTTTKNGKRRKKRK